MLSGNVEGAVSPNVFSLTLAVSQLAFIIFGGLGYVSGAVLGTALLMALPVWFTSLGTNEGILYAAVLLFVVIVSPRGMVSVAIDVYRALVRRFRPKSAPHETARSMWSPIRELLERARDLARRSGFRGGVGQFGLGAHGVALRVNRAR